MTSFDDELAALLALDALGPDEQADAELRLGTFHTPLSEASAALAEIAATAPPTDLRDAVIDRALARRPAGRPVDGAVPCPAPEAFDRTVADLYGLLASLTDAEWDLPAHPGHGRVRDLIAHLTGVERLSLRWLDPTDDVPVMVDHIASTRAVVDELAESAPQDLAALWHAAAREVVPAAARGDAERRVTFHDLTTSIDGFLITRTFELWAHSMDIAAATGRPMPELDPVRMATLSGRLMAAVPLALAYRGSTVPGRTARFVLTGPSGGCYTVPLNPGSEVGEPDVTLVADAIDLCRVAAHRLRPRDLHATVEGDAELAGLVLAGLSAFARD